MANGVIRHRSMLIGNGIAATWRLFMLYIRTTACAVKMLLKHFSHTTPPNRDLRTKTCSANSFIACLAKRHLCRDSEGSRGRKRRKAMVRLLEWIPHIVQIRNAACVIYCVKCHTIWIPTGTFPASRDAVCKQARQASARGFRYGSGELQPSTEP